MKTKCINKMNRDSLTPSELIDIFFYNTKNVSQIASLLKQNEFSQGYLENLLIRFLNDNLFPEEDIITLELHSKVTFNFQVIQSCILNSRWRILALGNPFVSSEDPLFELLELDSKTINNGKN